MSKQLEHDSRGCLVHIKGACSTYSFVLFLEVLDGQVGLDLQHLEGIQVAVGSAGP